MTFLIEEVIPEGMGVWWWGVGCALWLHLVLGLKEIPLLARIGLFLVMILPATWFAIILPLVVKAVFFGTGLSVPVVWAVRILWIVPAILLMWKEEKKGM